MKVLLALEFGFIWILGRWHQRGIEKDAESDDGRRWIYKYKWRACALRYPQAGREMAFSGQAPGVVAVFSSPRGWECIHTYVVQQEQYNRFEQVAYRLLTAILLCAKLGPPKKHEVLSLRCFLIGNRTPSVPNSLVQPSAKARSGERLMLVF